MKIDCTPYCEGCSATNCQSCNVLREWLKSRRHCSDFKLSKQDFDLENHFAEGL